MASNSLCRSPRIKRHAIRKDILGFALPGLTVFFLELCFCGEALDAFWSKVWGFARHPGGLLSLPALSIAGLAVVAVGFGFLLVGQVTLWRSYSGFVVIREDHQLVTRGVYRVTRNPMYLGLLLVVLGLPVYSLSLTAFLVSLLLIPIVLFRIGLEEALLEEEFQAAYREYKASTRRLIPFLY